MRSGSTPKCHGSATLIETNDHSDAVILMLKNVSVADPDPGFGVYKTLIKQLPQSPFTSNFF